jgi:hypothetical protein
LCNELAEFANATAASASHAIQLTTDWAFRPDPDNPSQMVFATEHCEHYGYDAGKKAN